MSGQKEITEIEKKKEYLRGYERAIRQMKRSELRIQEIRMRKVCPSMINDGMPHTSSQNDLSGYAALLDQEEKRYIKYRYQRAIKCQEIENKIERLFDEDEKDILVYRYIKLMKWEGKNGICQKMGISESGAYRLHGLALLHFEI